MKILIAVDSSETSTNAAREAAARLWPAGTSARVITVVEPVFALNGEFAPDIEDALWRSAQHTVQATVEYFEQAGMETSFAVLSGDPKTVIVKEAADVGADFIVIGAHSSHGVLRFLLGGVARAVARLAPCSVEIVRTIPSSKPLKILLATDGSPCSAAAVRSVAGRPWAEGTEFRIVSVVEPSAPLFHPPYFSPERMRALRGDDMKHAQQAICVAEDILGAAGIESSSAIEVPSATAKELILSEAADWGADMIVVGSHGRRGVSRAWLGSVSEAVALHAQCSVEIIRHHAA